VCSMPGGDGIAMFV